MLLIIKLTLSKYIREKCHEYLRLELTISPTFAITIVGFHTLSYAKNFQYIVE